MFEDREPTTAAQAKRANAEEAVVAAMNAYLEAIQKELKESGKNKETAFYVGLRTLLDLCESQTLTYFISFARLVKGSRVLPKDVGPPFLLVAKQVTDHIMSELAEHIETIEDVARASV